MSSRDGSLCSGKVFLFVIESSSTARSPPCARPLFFFHRATIHVPRIPRVLAAHRAFGELTPKKVRQKTNRTMRRSGEDPPCAGGRVDAEGMGRGRRRSCAAPASWQAQRLAGPTPSDRRPANSLHRASRAKERWVRCVDARSLVASSPHERTASFERPRTRRRRRWAARHHHRKRRPSPTSPPLVFPLPPSPLSLPRPLAPSLAPSLAARRGRAPAALRLGVPGRPPEPGI